MIKTSSDGSRKCSKNAFVLFLCIARAIMNLCFFLGSKKV